MTSEPLFNSCTKHEANEILRLFEAGRSLDLIPRQVGVFEHQMLAVLAGVTAEQVRKRDKARNPEIDFNARPHGCAPVLEWGAMYA